MNKNKILSETSSKIGIDKSLESPVLKLDESCSLVRIREAVELFRWSELALWNYHQLIAGKKNLNTIRNILEFDDIDLVLARKIGEVINMIGELILLNQAGGKISESILRHHHNYLHWMAHPHIDPVFSKLGHSPNVRPFPIPNGSVKLVCKLDKNREALNRLFDLSRSKSRVALLAGGASS